jgi:hypothetical protein
MPEYSQHELRTIADDYAKLCAALADLRDTALFDDIDAVDIDTAISPFSVVAAAKHHLIVMKRMIDIMKKELE